jgi:hypothetical protein
MSVLQKSFRQVKKKTLTVLDKQQLKSDWLGLTQQCRENSTYFSEFDLTWSNGSNIII